MTGNELFEAIQDLLGPEANRHRGIDAPARRDTAIAGGSYRAPGALVDGFRAGDADVEVTGVVVAARASTQVLRRANDLGANIVISRQAFLGDSQDRPVAKPERALAEKLAFIERNRMAVLRLQDPRIGTAGRAIAEALPNALGLFNPSASIGVADGLVYRSGPTTAAALARAVRSALGTLTVRLVGDPAMRLKGVAFATESNRPNALAPLLGRDDVDMLVAGEVHETETTAYVLDAIAIGRPRALLLVGSIEMEEPSARRLTEILRRQYPGMFSYVESKVGLSEVV